MLVYGRNVAKEVLKSNKKVSKIILQENFDDKEINSLIEKRKIKVEYLNKKGFLKFDKFLCPMIYNFRVIKQLFKCITSLSSIQ